MNTSNRMLVVLCLVTLPCLARADQPQTEGLQRPGPTILVLGDSITAAGHYVDDVETYLLLHERERLPSLVALGLGSETVTGLTEPEHPFPRPNVHDRLDRALNAVQPDIVWACYGMNDGIYHPFSEARFAAYQQGIRKLIDKSHAVGAKVVLLTPPPYAGSVIHVAGPKPGEPYGYQTPEPHYDDVLKRYSEWTLSLAGKENVDVIDVRTPLVPHLAKSYEGKDPIHPNRFGHELMAEAILAHLGYETGNNIIETGVSSRKDDEGWQQVRDLVAKRRRVLDNTLLWEIGHSRPGERPKMTIDEARRQAVDIDRQLAALLSADSRSKTSQSAASPKVRVESVRRAFHNGEHNAFTDLIRFRDKLYLTFRSCPDGHMVHPTSSILILSSDDDGVTWQQVNAFSVPRRDVRDPHFLEFNDQLFVYTGTWYCGETSPETRDLNQHLGYGVSSTDGEQWSEPFMLEGTYGHYIWRAAAHDGTAYLCGRRKQEFAETETGAGGTQIVQSAILASDDGRIWKHRGLFQEQHGNETAFLFEGDGSALAVARGGGSRNAELCRSTPPYVEWQRTELDRYIGGPLLARWGDRYVVGGRQTNGGPARMSLYWLNESDLEEFATLPSGGDCSYPGLVELADGSALVSYYSSHEKDDDGRPITAIYLATISR
jgi:lysophospholipase L1-like esterase